VGEEIEDKSQSFLDFLQIYEERLGREENKEGRRHVDNKFRK